MKRKIFTHFQIRWLLGLTAMLICGTIFIASSHREAPLIAEDPLADNTDLYAFRSPANPDKVIIIANWIPFELPQGGPNFYQFGKDIRYEIHIDNNIATPGDDIIYRFTFTQYNQDPSTFFNIRLGKQNLRTTFLMQKSVDGGKDFNPVLRSIILPPNIGPRSIETKLGYGSNAAPYNTLINRVIKTANTGEKVYVGTSDDPFFVDLGGIFDLGDAPRQSGTPIDGLKCLNVSTIAMEVDISSLQKEHKNVSAASSILDPNYVIGVWASASRRQLRTINAVSDNQATETHSGAWVQVSRLGMPLTNEAVIPIGKKDIWNRLTPYNSANFNLFKNSFYNPELALYMDDSKFGGAVPAFKPLRVQSSSLGTYDFRNGHDGLFPLKGNAALNGTALAESAFGGLLLPAAGSPRSVDLWPIFHTGVPNLAPYQLATGKGGNPLAAGKPFINNFLPNGGDMLRLNMAVPATPRNSTDFSSLGLVQAAVLGLTDSRYNTNTNIQFIPNMDGFPNGRRLEDDVTRIELQAVGGIVLAAIGLWYDDYTGGNPVTPRLVNTLTYSTGVEYNDTTFKPAFPFVQTPWAGTHVCDCGNSTPGVMTTQQPVSFNNESKLGIASPEIVATTSPNPVYSLSKLSYKVDALSKIKITVYDGTGKVVRVLADKSQPAGTYNIQWSVSALPKGSYFVSITKNGQVKQTLPLIKSE